MKNLGYSFQKAQFVSDHLDPQKRTAWLQEVWPRLLQQAKRRKALILFGDEAAFAQWGSLSYTWSRCGQTPLVKTSGKRKADKVCGKRKADKVFGVFGVFGAIEFFSGRLFYQGIEGRFNSASYQAFLNSVLSQTHESDA